MRSGEDGPRAACSLPCDASTKSRCTDMQKTITTAAARKRPRPVPSTAALEPPKFQFCRLPGARAPRRRRLQRGRRPLLSTPFCLFGTYTHIVVGDLAPSAILFGHSCTAVPAYPSAPPLIRSRSWPRTAFCQGFVRVERGGGRGLGGVNRNLQVAIRWRTRARPACQP